MSAPTQQSLAVRPEGPLRRVVRQHHAYRERNVPPAQHLGLPSPYLTLIFTLDEPLQLVRPVPHEYRTLVGGLHSAPAVIAHDGAQSGIQLQFSPLGARALFGVPAGELRDLDLPAADLLGAVADELQEQLRAASSWQDRFRLLDARLGQRLNLGNMPPAEICLAWQALRRSYGLAGIAAIAREVGWSERHLAKQFRAEIGLTPKTAGRVIRFDRARRMLWRTNGADAAARCGYADQSHLVRDFTAFAGRGPRAWLAGEVGNIQVSHAYEHAELPA